MSCIILLIPLMQYINWWSEILTSIIHFREIVSKELVRMCSSSEEDEHVIPAGSVIISVN